jgi:hypothetical protein
VQKKSCVYATLRRIKILKRNSKIVIEFFLVGTIKNNELNLRKKRGKKKANNMRGILPSDIGKKILLLFQTRKREFRERENKRVSWDEFGIRQKIIMYSTQNIKFEIRFQGRI